MKKFDFKKILEVVKNYFITQTKGLTIMDSIALGLPTICMVIHVIDGFDLTLYLGIVISMYCYTQLRDTNEGI